jgi:hypothetical protein
MFQTLGTFRTCASSTHEEMCRDSCSPGAQVVIFFRINLEASCHKIRIVNSFYQHTEARTTFMFYKSTSCHEFDGGCGHIHASSTSCREFDGGYSHVHALSTSRHDL